MDVTNEAVLSVFSVILGQQPGDRKLAEQRLTALETLEAFPSTLVNLLVDQDLDVSFRQLAAITLEHYVTNHWVGQSNTEISQVQPAEETKELIRTSLIQVLQTPDRRIRTIVAHLISVIAQFDWPDSWPNLMPQLAHLLESMFTQGDVKSEQKKIIIHGVMNVLSHISVEMTDLDVSRIAPVLMPLLVQILCEKQFFSYSVRKNVAAVISNLANALMDNVMIEKIGSFLGPCINQLLADLSSAGSSLMASSFETEVVQLLTLLCNTTPKFATKYVDGGIQRLVIVSCQLLVRVADTYIQSDVNATVDDSPEVVDSDGDTVEYEYLVHALLEHFSCLLNTKRYRSRLEPHLQELAYHLARLSQLPNATITKSSDIGEFLDEREGSLSCTVRQAALEVIRKCVDYIPSFSTAFTATVCRLLVTAETQHAQGDPNWWKLLEVGLFLCGTFPKSFISCESSILPDTLKSRYLEPSWQQCDLPFLQVSALQCATQFTINDCAGGPTLENLPALLVDALDSSKHGIVRASAVSAVSDACTRLEEACSVSTNPQVKTSITTHLPTLVSNIVDCLAVLGEPVLDNGLYALQGLLHIDPQSFTLSAQPQLTSILLNLFKHCISVASTLSVYLDVIRALQQAGNASTVEDAFMPILLNCLEQQEQPQDSVAVEASLQVLGVLIRGSSVPLSPILIQRAFPAVIHLAIIGEDAMLLTACCEVLRCYLAVDVESILDWHDDEGNNGISYILHVTSRLLDPSAPIEWATFAGRLVCAILLRVKSEQLGENTDLLLRGTLARLSSLPAVSDGTCRGAQQSLIFVFVVLFRTRPEAGIAFLSSVPDLSGRPVIERVMRLWCDCQLLYVASHELRISIQSMSNLLVHTIRNQDTRLMQMTAEEVIETSLSNDTHSIAERTRQKQKETPETRIQIPLLVKMYKLLIYELAKVIEEEEDDDEEDSEDDDEDDNQEEDEVGQETQINSATEPHQESLDFDGPNIGSSEALQADESDPLFVDDPIYSDDPALKIDIKDLLCNLFRELVQQPFYNEFSRYHTQSELATLQHVGLLQLG